MKPNPPDPWVLVGKIGKPIGLEGVVRIWPEAELGEIFEKQVPMMLWAPPKLPGKPFRVRSAKRDGKGWIARPEGVAGRTEASALTNVWVVAAREDLPEPEAGHVYWADLLKARVESKQGESLGIVAEVFDTAAGTVVQVKPSEGDEFLIPFTEEVDADFVSSEKKGEPGRLLVHLPAGMREATAVTDKPAPKKKKKRGPRLRKKV